MVSNIIVILLQYIGLALLELGKFFSRYTVCVMEPVFWLMQFGCTKMQRQKLAYAG